MHQDPSEQFAPNPDFDADIHQVLADPNFSEASRQRMRKKIRDARDASLKHGTAQADADARHIFREFLPAKELNGHGFHLEYSENIDGRTPDWYDRDNNLLLEVFTCERGGTSDPVQRVASTIVKKVEKYRGVVENALLFFVVAVYGDFLIPFIDEDCRQAIDEGHLFDRHTELSGVIFFAESNFRNIQPIDGPSKLRRKQMYQFTYFDNPNATRKINLAMNLAPHP